MYGTYSKLLSVNVWCLRFVSNLKCKFKYLSLNLASALTPDELHRSGEHLFLQSKTASFVSNETTPL